MPNSVEVITRMREEMGAAFLDANANDPAVRAEVRQLLIEVMCSFEQEAIGDAMGAALAAFDHAFERAVEVDRQLAEKMRAPAPPRGWWTSRRTFPIRR